MRVPSIWMCPKCKEEDGRHTCMMYGQRECRRCDYAIGSDPKYDAILQKEEDDVMRMKASLYPFIPEVPIAEYLQGEAKRMMEGK